jgi:hypothetical protein
MNAHRALLHLCASVLVVNGALWGTDAAYRQWVVKPRLRAQEHARLRAKEDELRRDLLVMRSAIRVYTADRHFPPTRLKQLVYEGYLPEIPPDPITGTAATWRVVVRPLGDSCFAGDGIVNVRSGSNAVDSSGTRLYLEW